MSPSNKPTRGKVHPQPLNKPAAETDRAVLHPFGSIQPDQKGLNLPDRM